MRSGKYTRSEISTDQGLLTTDDKYYLPTADGTLIQLGRLNQIVVVTNNAATVVALPSVAASKGISYDVSVENDGNAITLTAYPNDLWDVSESWGGDYVLDTADDRIVLRSDGQSWSVETNEIAT